MATNRHSDGAVLSHVASGAILSGGIVKLGSVDSVEGRIGIAVADIANTKTGALSVQGVYKLPKTTGAAINQGVPVYLNAADSDNVTATSTSNHRCGRAAAAAASAETTCLVKIDW